MPQKVEIDEVKQDVIRELCAESERRLKGIQNWLENRSDEEGLLVAGEPRSFRSLSLEQMQALRTDVENESLQLLQKVGTLIGNKIGDKISGELWVQSILSYGLRIHCTEEVRERVVRFVRTYSLLVDEQIVSAHVNALCNACERSFGLLEAKLSDSTDDVEIAEPMHFQADDARRYLVVSLAAALEISMSSEKNLLRDTLRSLKSHASESVYSRVNELLEATRPLKVKLLHAYARTLCKRLRESISELRGSPINAGDVRDRLIKANRAIDHFHDSIAMAVGRLSRAKHWEKGLIENLSQFFPNDQVKEIKQIRNEAVLVRKQLEHDLKRLDRTFMIKQRSAGLSNPEADKEVEALCRRFGAFVSGARLENLPLDSGEGLQVITNLKLETQGFVRSLADAVTYRLGEDFYQPGESAWPRRLLKEVLFNRLSLALPLDLQKATALNAEANEIFFEAKLKAQSLEERHIENLCQTFKQTLTVVLERPVETSLEVRMQLSQVDAELTAFLKNVAATIGYSIDGINWRGSIINSGLPIHAWEERPLVLACRIFARCTKKQILSTYAESCCRPLEEILQRIESKFQYVEEPKTAPSEIKAAVDRCLKPIDQALGRKTDDSAWQSQFAEDLPAHFFPDMVRRVNDLLERSIVLRKLSKAQTIDTQAIHLEYSTFGIASIRRAVSQCRPCTINGNSYHGKEKAKGRSYRSL
jgi:hypothetical protein